MGGAGQVTGAGRDVWCSNKPSSKCQPRLRRGSPIMHCAVVGMVAHPVAGKEESRQAGMPLLLLPPCSLPHPAWACLPPARYFNSSSPTLPAFYHLLSRARPCPAVHGPAGVCHRTCHLANGRVGRPLQPRPARLQVPLLRPLPLLPDPQGPSGHGEMRCEFCNVLSPHPEEPGWASLPGSSSCCGTEAAAAANASSAAAVRKSFRSSSNVWKPGRLSLCCYAVA